MGLVVAFRGVCVCAWLTNAGFHDLYCITYHLTHTGEDAVLDTLTSGPTTIDISVKPNISFSVQALGVLP